MHSDTIQGLVPLLLVGAVLVYVIAARLLDRANVTAPMFFVVVGVLIGDTGLNVVSVDPGEEWLLVVAEVTLAMLLFADATHLRLRQVEGDPRPVARLLFIGFPLSLAVGTLLVFAVFPSGGWVAAALISALLAPTDAALGAAVVNDKRVPNRVRRLLNVESGLNDGLVTPVVTVLIAVLASEAGLIGDESWELQAARELSVAVAVAFVIGWTGGVVLRLCRARGWTSLMSDQVAVLALALLCYATAIAVEANGFIAAFVGGMVFAAAFGATAVEKELLFTEATGLVASYVVWLAFGAALVGQELAGATAGTYVIAVGALTLARMLPVALALAGGHWGAPTVAFVGWFGPRGLATVIFALIALESLGETVSDQVVEVASVTVLLSVFAHGLTAAPLAGRYGRWSAGQPAAAPERLSVTSPERRRMDLQTKRD
jgi:NhaP-type Na+/H+ or K+/H+ antiporter